LAGSTEEPLCIFVLGPTASGKSQWALEQAIRYGGSVVNIDSVQFYKDLLVGSAAPGETEKKQAPHYLYSYVAAPNEMTAGIYLRDFYAMLEAQNPKFPLFITGGTGFYIQALEKGMFDIEPVPENIRREIESELQLRGARELHRELLARDPQSKIHVNDHFRLVRALEIIRSTGKTPTELNSEIEKNKKILPFRSLKIGFDFEKSEYEKRVRHRTEKMLNAGIIEETESFLRQGFADWAPLRSVGYRETAQYLKQVFRSASPADRSTHSANKAGLCDEICHSTMKLIKKQKTWFKRDGAILWSNHAQELARFLS
jgi:tRNA dimethylallyltransferase